MLNIVGNEFALISINFVMIYRWMLWGKDTLLVVGGGIYGLA